MTKFNQKASTPFVTPNTTNLAGGKAFTFSLKMEIVTILLTSFVTDKVYEKADQTIDRLAGLILSLSTPEDIKFVAKAIIYARTVFGMRSITHVATVLLAQKLRNGEPYAKSFFSRVIYRPDDMMEIMSYWKLKYPTSKGRVPNVKAMQKGFAEAIAKMTPYQLAKYRAEGKQIKLVDVVNWCHPVGSDSPTLKLLLKGELKQEDTWEAMLSEAGPDPIKKARVWSHLIDQKKLGYLALLRNLRNIMEQAPQTLPFALHSLTDENFIKKSLIMPFQYMVAYEEFSKNGDLHSRMVTIALSKAIDISLGNVPKFEGDTLVVVDVSGSMMTTPVAGSKTSVAKVAAMFGTVIAKGNNADFMVFGDDAAYYHYNPLDTTLTTIRNMTFLSGGTCFPSIFYRAKKKYDRIIILSDMQGWKYFTAWQSMSRSSLGGSIEGLLKDYRKKFNANPLIYSFDLAGYGTLQVHEERTYLMAGFSDKAIQIMHYLEKNKRALQNEIEKVEL